MSNNNIKTNLSSSGKTTNIVWKGKILLPYFLQKILSSLKDLISFLHFIFHMYLVSISLPPPSVDIYAIHVKWIWVAIQKPFFLLWYLLLKAYFKMPKGNWTIKWCQQTVYSHIQYCITFSAIYLCVYKQSETQNVVREFILNLCGIVITWFCFLWNIKVNSILYFIFYDLSNITIILHI